MTLETILATTRDATGRTVEEIKSRSRYSEHVFARGVFVYLAYKYGYSSTKIGQFLRKDHTTIIHAYRRACATPRILQIVDTLAIEPSKPDLGSGISQQNQRKFGRIYERFGGKCFVCAFTSVVEICHIKPRYLGGSDDPSNLLLLCPNHHAMFDRGLLILRDIPVPALCPQP